MSRIQVLPERIINIIAAGEVVERPASVVKELAENALDAGAGQVFITVADGGKVLLSVLDNGAGMDAEDVRKAVLRHATSKLHDEQGLEDIRSLGFRGEALASIAAVSRFELISCDDEQAGGTRISLEGGREQTLGGVGFPRGTKVTVRELFFNTPARRKFLRATATEFQHIQTICTQLALSHPAVHFRLTHNRKLVHDLTPCGELKERVFQLFGGELAEGMITVRGREGTVGFEGLVSLPSDSRASRRWQYLFINGRPVRNPGINHGIYQAYRTLLMKGRHPAYVLNLELEPGEVDVNVHPAKTEVRIRNPKLVHTVLADRLHKALMDSSRRRAFAAGTPEYQREVQNTAMAREGMAGGEGRAGGGEAPQVEMALRGGAVSSAAGALSSAAGAVLRDVAIGGTVSPAAAVSAAAGAVPAVAGADGAAEVVSAHPPQEADSGQSPASSSLLDNPYGGGDFYFQPLSGKVRGAAFAEADYPSGGAMTLLGQLHATYLLAQREGRLVVVDQHAAHERILFEQYRRQFYDSRLITEAYLIPLTLELSAQNGLLLEQYLPQWEKLGFGIEPFGKSTYLVRQIPAILSGKDVKQLILEALDDLALFGKSGKVEEVINEILERVACHSAIRAGMQLSREEMASLLDQLEQLDINLHCPHGRPVWVEFPLKELEKRFKRIV